jgi:hypothetical protein
MLLFADVLRMIRQDSWSILHPLHYFFFPPSLSFLSRGTSTQCRVMTSPYGTSRLHSLDTSACRKDLYLTTKNTQNRQTFRSRRDSNPQSQPASGHWARHTFYIKCIFNLRSLRSHTRNATVNFTCYVLVISLEDGSFLWPKHVAFLYFLNIHVVLTDCKRFIFPGFPFFSQFDLCFDKFHFTTITVFKQVPNPGLPVASTHVEAALTKVWLQQQ